MTDDSAPRPTRARSKPEGAPKPTKSASKPAAPATRRAVAVPVVGDPPEAATSAAGNAAAGSAGNANGAGPAMAGEVVTGPGQLTIEQGGVGAVTAREVSVTQGGIGAARAQSVSVELGGIGAAMTNQLTVRQGLVGAVIARDASFEQAGVRSLIANHVAFGPNSGAAVVIAARVEGDVRPLFDWRAALAFGLAAGAVGTLLRGRRR
jgi:hypothetical protein